MLRKGAFASVWCLRAHSRQGAAGRREGLNLEKWYRQMMKDDGAGTQMGLTVQEIYCTCGWEMELELGEAGGLHHPDAGQAWPL